MGIFTALKEFVRSSKEIDPMPINETDVENATKAWEEKPKPLSLADMKPTAHTLDTMARHKRILRLRHELRQAGVDPAPQPGEGLDEYENRMKAMLNYPRGKVVPAYTMGNPNPVSFHAQSVQHTSSGNLRGQRSQYMYYAEQKEVEPSVTRVNLEEYVQMLQSIPIVHKVHILFDDRPNEVSIRVEYLENMLNLDREILQDANEELTKVTSFIRIKNCERIEITYIQKEVIL